MDQRLAALKDEIDRIMSTGPIGQWSNAPSTFPLMGEAVVFNADGTGLITTSSAMSGKSVQAFTWSMEAPGRIEMRYRLTRYAERADADVEEPDPSPELAPVAFGIEIVVQETEFGSWPVLVSEGSDTFDCMRTGLARTEPPLHLAQPAPAKPPRSFLSRVRSLVFGPRLSGHA